MVNPAVGSLEERTAQLVTELMVADLDRSLAFYTALGFELERRHGEFAVLSWAGERLLFLDENRSLTPAGDMRANVRVVVPDADAAWRRALASGAPVAREIGDRPYGIRDFTVRDPDGFGVRFAAPLSDERG